MTIEQPIKGEAAQAAKRLSARPPADSPDTLGRAVARFFKGTSPRILMGLSAVMIGLRALHGPLHWTDFAVAGGIVAFWPVLEWLIHTQLLHFRPRKIGKWVIDPAFGREHREHHADPWNLDILFIPLRTYPIYFSILGGIYWATGGAPAVVTAAATYALFGLHYEWCHYLAHIRYRPRLRYYQRIVQKHRLHHFHNEKLWWGVSMTGGDWLLGTGPAPESAPRSPTTRMVYDL